MWENNELVLPRPEVRYDGYRDSVIFWGLGRGRRVRCVISEKALHDHFNGDGKDLISPVFGEHHVAIDETALRLNLTKPLEADGTVAIHSEDILDRDSEYAVPGRFLQILLHDLRIRHIVMRRTGQVPEEKPRLHLLPFYFLRPHHTGAVEFLKSHGDALVEALAVVILIG